MKMFYKQNDKKIQFEIIGFCLSYNFEIPNHIKKITKAEKNLVKQKNDDKGKTLGWQNKIDKSDESICDQQKLCQLNNTV